jgi:WD40 repeat protein
MIREFSRVSLLESPEAAFCCSLHPYVVGSSTRQYLELKGWDFESGKTFLDLNSLSRITLFAISKDDRYLATYDARQVITIWSLRNGNKLSKSEPIFPPYCIEFGHSGDWLAIGGQDTLITLSKTNAISEPSFSVLGGPGRGLIFGDLLAMQASCDNVHLFSKHRKNVIVMWNTQTESEVRHIELLPQIISVWEKNLDAFGLRFLDIADNHHEIRIRNSETNQVIGTILTTEIISGACFSKSGRNVITWHAQGSDVNIVNIWEGIRNIGELIYTLQHELENGEKCEWIYSSDSEKYILSTCSRRTRGIDSIRLWHVEVPGLSNTYSTAHNSGHRDSSRRKRNELDR